MNTLNNDLTQAQKSAYWESIRGTTIRWQGTLEDAYSNNGGQIYLRCSRRSNYADVSVSVQPDQISRLGQLNKGQRITFTGLVGDCGTTYYTVTNGRVEGI